MDSKRLAAALLLAVRRAGGVACALLALVATACSGERLVRIASDAAPLFPDAEPIAADPSAVLHAGDLVEVLGAGPNSSFRGALEGTEASREGALVRVRRAAGESPGFLFASDLGGAVRVPSAASLCHALGPSIASCEERLRRVDVTASSTSETRATIGYVPCDAGPCPIGLARGRSLEALSWAGLHDLRFARVTGQPIAIAYARFARPNVASESAIVLRLEPSLRRDVEIVLDERDHTGPNPRVRQGSLTVRPDGMRFVGTQRLETDRGDVLASRDLDETYRISPPPRSR